MSPGRAATLASSSVIVVVGLFAIGLVPPGEEQFLSQVASVLVPVGIPLAVAAALLATRAARAAIGRDLPERLLAVTTAGLTGGRAEWSKAMRSELASIQESGRLRFALGCSATAIRTGIGRRTWLIALGAGAMVALGTLMVARFSLAGAQGGVLGFTIVAPPVALLAAGFVGARPNRSFREGLEAGVLALLVALAMMLAVEVWEAGRWYDLTGAFVTDGDTVMGLTRTEALLDPVSPSFVVLHLVFWSAWPVIGAAWGARRFGRRSPQLRTDGQLALPR